MESTREVMGDERAKEESSSEECWGDAESHPVEDTEEADTGDEEESEYDTDCNANGESMSTDWDEENADLDADEREALEDDEDEDVDENEEGDEVEEEEEEDEEEEEEEEDEDDDEESNIYLRRNRQLLLRFEKLPKENQPLDHPLAHVVKLQTSASTVMPGVRPGVAGVRDPGNVVNAFKLLMRREQNVSRMGRFTKSECCHIARHYLPSKSRIVDQMHSKAYIGQFNKQGDTFIGCFQNKSIRLYDTETDFKLRKEVQARGLRWTITDTSLSPDQRWLVYSSITPIVHMVNMASSGATSIANVTDIHETLDFGPDQCGLYGRQGIWSLEFSHDGREIAAGMGAGDPALCLLDMDTGKVTVRVRGHRDDVNAVRYADASSNILFTGSDDRMCKVWDRRILGSTSGAPVGVLLGHTEGITHIDSKGDGLHLISNGKDQAVRLWDIRKMLNPSEAREALQRWHFPQFHWDYRCMDYPGVGLAIRHPRDCSVQAYRGHRVLETLIRCYFSPMHTTGQRYIYTGSHEGSVHMYDVVTGKEMRKLDAHISTVRDMSWHPTLPLLVSVSWDGTIRRWDHQR